MPRYRIFVVYAGYGAKNVAVCMARCLTRQGFKAYIAVPNLRQSVSVSRQSGIIDKIWELHCYAVLAVSTSNSNMSRKFHDEVAAAKYGIRSQMKEPIPLIAFLKKGAKNILTILAVNCSRIEFEGGRHNQKCQEVADMVRYEIREWIRFHRPPPIMRVRRNPRRRKR